MTRLAGRAAIVTGAARGIGRGYALRLGALGAHVAVCDRNLRAYEEFEEERALMSAETTVQEVEALGVEALGFEGDVGDRAAMDELAGRTLERWGRIDVLVCNAGGGSGSPSGNRGSEIDPGELDEVLRRNLIGTINCCSAVAPAMKRQRAGKIVTVSSVSGLQASEDGGYAHYGIAKAGIVMYTRYLARELGPYGITVNALAPGPIGTGRLLPKLREMGLEQLEQQTALRRIGTVEDCAGALEFLVTDLSAYVTGHVIPVDGGMMRGGL